MSYNNNYNRYQKKNNGTSGTPKFQDASVPKFCGKLQPLMKEEQKAAERVPIDELAFDFSCRVTRMYKWLNEALRQAQDKVVV